MASVTQAIKLENRNQKPEKTKRDSGCRAAAFGFYLLVSSFWFLVSALGCVHLPNTGPDEPMPHGAVCQVVATWNHQVVFAPDPTHDGAPTPGLAGRLYLFGQEISYPLVEEGSLIVDLFDDTKPATEGQPLPLEEWRLDSGTLKRLVKRDMIGYGYTLFLPWGTYKPEINQVHLKVRFVTAKGASFYADSGRVSLDKSIEPVTHSAVAATPKADAPPSVGATSPAGPTVAIR